MTKRFGIRSPSSAGLSKVRWRNVDVTIAKFESQSLISLLEAAADSPGCGNRLPSLTLLWTRALRHSHHSGITADLSHLRSLLDVVHGVAPRIIGLEDTWNADPRLVVRHRIGSERFRYHPGGASDPAQLLRMIDTTANAIDDFTLDRRGFSLSDLVESALRYSDLLLAQIHGSWPTAKLNRDEQDSEDESLQNRALRIATSPIQLSQLEIDLRQQFSFEAAIWTNACAHPDRAARAWRWATADAIVVSPTLAPGTPHLGPILAIDSADTSHPVPASLVLDALMSAHVVLAHEAAIDDRSRRSMSVLTVSRAFELLGVHDSTISPSLPDAETNSRVEDNPFNLGLTFQPSSLHAFVFAVASGLTVTDVSESVSDAHHALEDLSLETVTETPHSLDHGATIHRVVAYGGPTFLKPFSHAGPTHLHVEELAMIKLDSQQVPHGHDLVFQFLDELTTMPMLHELHFVEFSDIWRHWKLHGALNFTGMSDIDVLTDIRQSDDAWLAATAWEPIESVLNRAELPSIWRWPIAHLVDADHAQLGTADNAQFTVLVDPPLIVRHSIQSELADLGIDPAFITGVVDGLILTVRNYPEIASAMRTPSGGPLRIDLTFVAERPPVRSDEVLGFGLLTSIDPYPQVSLLIGPDWFEALVNDPRSAHSGFGGALFHCLAQVHGDDQDAWISTHGGFKAEWDIAPPLAILQLTETPLRARNVGSDTLPRTIASLGRARRSFASAIVESRAPIGTLYGDDAIAFCKEVVVPAFESAINNFIAPWSADSIVELANHLNDAHAERVRAEGSLFAGLAAPWGTNWRNHALISPEPSEMTRPIELLVELTMARNTFGAINPDRFAIAEAADLALIGLDIAAALAGAVKGLHSLVTKTGAGGICDVASFPSAIKREWDWSEVDLRNASAINAEAFMKVRRLHQLRLKAAPVAESNLKLRLAEDQNDGSIPFVRFEELDIPRPLTRANEAMLETCGTGFNGLFSVLGTAGDWTSGSDRVEIVPLSELRREVASWSHVSLTEINAAIERLALRHDDLVKYGIHYWEIENRRIRVATRPLLLVGDDVVLIPWLIDATKRVYMTYMTDGRLPWHESEIPDSVKRLFNRYRTIQNRKLEVEAASVTNELRLPNKSRVLPNQAAAVGLTIPGEIDLLVADPNRARLWVCEVKDVHAAFSASRIQRRVGKFTSGGGGFFRILDSKVRAIEDDIPRALRLLGVPYKSEVEWSVFSAIISRDVEPAAFVHKVHVSFCMIEDFDQLLMLETQPLPSYAWMTNW